MPSPRPLKPGHVNPAPSILSRGRAARPPRWLACFSLLLLSALFPLDAAAALGGEKLEAVESALEKEKGHQRHLVRKAKALAGEVANLRREMIAAARLAQESEERLSSLETTLDELNVRAAAKRVELIERRQQMTGTVAALERLALRPPEALLVQPRSPVDSIRSALLLRTAIPSLEARSRALRADLTTLEELRREIMFRHNELLAATQTLEDDRVWLEGLIKRKSRLLEEVTEDRRKTAARMKKLAAEAVSLRDLVNKVDPQKPLDAEARRDEGADSGGDAAKGVETAALAPPSGRSLMASDIPFSKARGMLTFPARGKVVKRYGESLGAGILSKGLRIETRSAGQVVAPYDGKVVFAGRFRGYGQLLIIAHGEGYHVLLSGLSRIDTGVDEDLLAGEPVGIMGQPKDGNPSLYFELRRKGEPINPLPWLVASRERVSG